MKKTKARFDRLKLDTMQKIDLLAASRCNMFSHVLANYQSTLLHFWSKTSRTMSTVADSFKGYQYYEFNMLKVSCARHQWNSRKVPNWDSLSEFIFKKSESWEGENSMMQFGWGFTARWLKPHC